MQVLLLAGRTLRDLRGAEFNSLRNRPVGFHATYLSPLSTHSERWESSGKEDDEGGGGGGREEEEEKEGEEEVMTRTATMELRFLLLMFATCVCAVSYTHLTLPTMAVV